MSEQIFSTKECVILEEFFHKYKNKITEGERKDLEPIFKKIGKIKEKISLNTKEESDKKIMEKCVQEKCICKTCATKCCNSWGPCNGIAKIHCEQYIAKED